MPELTAADVDVTDRTMKHDDNAKLELNCTLGGQKLRLTYQETNGSAVWVWSEYENTEGKMEQLGKDSTRFEDYEDFEDAAVENAIQMFPKLKQLAEN